MIVRILIGFAIVTVVILLLLWLATGGTREIASIARNITNPFDFIFSGRLSNFRLPWQPEQITRGPIVNAAGPEGEEEERTAEEELAAAEREYGDLAKATQDMKTFGEPSPYRNRVTLSQAAASEALQEEYLALETGWDTTSPVNISGWSVQSALTGIRAYIPRGAHPFILGSINAQTDIYLEPGSSAFLTTTISPLGTSFRENACTGYLASLRKFTPPLERSCPAPSESLPLTPENIRDYGEACFDYVQTIPECTLPPISASTISPACHIFLSNTLSYNGCVQTHRHESGFARASWRIYLNAAGELWRNAHDIIRLLDSEGRTVDMVSY